MIPSIPGASRPKLFLNTGAFPEKEEGNNKIGNSTTAIAAPAQSQ
jgi:hypothetical protein